MEKIIITGVAGFIGFHLWNKLQTIYQVSGIDSIQNNASQRRFNLLDNIQATSIHSNFLDEMEVKPKIVVHLGAETGIAGSLLNPQLYFHQNIEGTFNVLEQCRKNGVKYLIYASSSSVYEPNQAVMAENSPHSNQLSFYGTSKRMTEVMVENYCKQFGMVAIGLRFFTVYGSWTRPDMAAYKFMRAIQANEAITLYKDGNVFRDFTHVSDITNAIALLCSKITSEKKGFHEIFNIGYGAPVSVKTYAETIAKHLNKELKFINKPLPSNELEATHSNCSKLETYIQYKPSCSINEGIEEMTNWFNHHRYD